MNDTVLRGAIVNSFDVTVHHMRCAEHTLQLGNKDALKLDGIGRFLTKIRDVAGRLRTPQTDTVLKHHNKSMIIDVATHLGNTFAMLKRLLELRSTTEHENLGDREINLSTGAKFRNWLMFWLFHKTQPFNFKEKTLPLESVFWHCMKPFLNYAKKCGYSTYYCRKSRKAYAIYYAKQTIFSSSRPMNGFKIPNFVKLGSKRKSQTGTFFLFISD